MCFIIAEFHSEVHSLSCLSWQELSINFQIKQKEHPPPLLLKGQQLVSSSGDEDISTVTLKLFAYSSA